MLVMRLVVPSSASYAIQQLSNHAGVQFDDRQVVDVPLNTREQIQAAKELADEFADGLSKELRNGPNAVSIYSCEVVSL